MNLINSFYKTIAEMGMEILEKPVFHIKPLYDMFPQTSILLKTQIHPFHPLVACGMCSNFRKRKLILQFSNL